MIDTKALKQKILDLAIHGKLVPQDPSDEPASALLEKIRAEKQRLIKEGKIKSDKSDSVIYKGDDNRYYEKIGNNEPVLMENLPFEIPDSWAWVRVQNYTLTVFNGKPPKYSKVPTAHKVIGQQANQWDGVNLEYVNTAPKNLHRICLKCFIFKMEMFY